MSVSASKQSERLVGTGLTEETWLLLATSYGVIIAGAVPLAVAELSPVYALLAAFLCVMHAVLVGAAGRPLLPDAVCKLLSIGALFYALIETVVLDVHVSYSLGHFLVLVQLILLYGPHRLRELRLIPVVALFELMVAGISALDLVYLPAFVLTAFAVMANLTALDMHSDAGMCRRAAGLPAAEGSVGRRDFLSALWLSALLVFLVTAVLFPVLPRFGGMLGRRQMGRELVTGFSEDVSLQEVGLLRQSERVAFRVQFFRNDQTDKPVSAPAQLLMRGTSLPIYRHGQWFGYAEAIRPTPGAVYTREMLRNSYFASEDVYALRGADVPTELILQKVRLTEAPGRILFALYRPMALDSGASYDLVRGGTSHDVINLSEQLEDNAYKAVSMVPSFAPKQLQEAGTPRPSPPWLAFWDVPAQLQPVLTSVRDEIEDLYHPTTDYDRVIAAERYLVSSGRFAYTLDLADYGAEDPIVAFLTQTRRGCCEHFSTALALILRTWSIPTRLVVGYKEGTYDADDQSYVFRDRDAHAWVEVYFNNLGWVEFDPSPSSDASLHQPGTGAAGGFNIFGRLSQAATGLLYYVNAHWNTHVIGYTRTQQKAVMQELTEAARGLTADAASVLRVVWPGLPDLGFLQVALVVVGITFVGISLYLFAGWLDRALRQRRRARPGRTLRFYEELLAIMRSKGLRRPLHQTPREFARVVAAQFGPQDSSVTQAVDLVTDLYYRARFGGYELSAEEQSQMRDALRKLKNIPRLRRIPGQSAAPA